MQTHLCCLLVSVRILQIGIFNCALYILANNQRTCCCMLAPPLNKCGVISSLMTNLPIELRHAVIHPTVVYPQQDIGIQIVVVLSSVGIATYWRTLFVSIDSKWRDTNLYPRFY